MNTNAEIKLQSVKIISCFLRIMSDTELIPVAKCNSIDFTTKITESHISATTASGHGAHTP